MTWPEAVPWIALAFIVVVQVVRWWMEARR